MGLNIEAGLAVVQKYVNNCYYSMYGSRYYTDGTCDCSGSVYRILRESGGFNYGYIPSTETLHDYLLKLGYELIAENSDFPMQRGDVIIWGKKGYSAGAFGHTGVALDNQRWIECTGWKMTTIIANHDERWVMAGCPYFYAYRLKGASSNQGNTTNNSNSNQTQEQPKIKEEKLMYIYWKQNSVKKDQFDGFFVNGNKRMHMPNATVLNECRTLVKEWGFNTFEPQYSHDNFRVATIEKTTDLVKW